MKIEIDNAQLIDGELVNAKTICTIEKVQNVRIYENNKFIAVDTPTNHGFNCLLIDTTKFNISIYND